MSRGDAYTRVITALETRGARREGNDWTCPAHDDHKPSLSVTSKDDRVLLHCHADCSVTGVVAALGLSMAELFDDPLRDPKLTDAVVDATYDYTDENGTLLFQVLRLYPKGFRQRRPDGNGGWARNLNGVRRVPYRLPKVIAAVKAGETVYIVEGEKDVYAIEKAGAVATCNAGGASKWRPEFSGFLEGAAVVVVADRDAPGYRHAAEVAASVRHKAASVVVVEAVEGKDAADHLEAGHDVDEFQVVDDARLKAGMPEPEDRTAPEPDRVVRTTWYEMDLIPALTGEGGEPPPELFTRTDGKALVYVGKTHSFHGEPGSGKSAAAQWIAVTVIARGEHVLYIDFESDRESVVGRFLGLGATDEQIRRCFHYIRPDEPLTDGQARKDFGEMLGYGPAFAVIDGVAEAMSLQGLDPNFGPDVAKFNEKVARPLERIGAAVVSIDHVPKDKDGRGGWAIGSGHKIAALSGAAYAFQLVRPFGRGLEGMARIKVGKKDRPGHVQRLAVNKVVGEFHLRDEDGRATAWVRPPEPQAGDGFRPTFLMERISDYLLPTLTGGPALSQDAIVRGVKGRAEYVRQALRLLVEEEYVEVDRVPGRAHLHRLVRTYSNSGDQGTTSDD